MVVRTFTLLLWLAAAGVGCHHKTDAKSELQKTADLLDKAEPAPSPAPAPPVQAAPAASAPEQPAANPAPASPPQMVRQAIAAYKNGNFEDAVTRLQMLRATPTLTPEQRMSLQDSVAAVMAELYAMAEKGDPRAVQAVQQYEKLQTRPR